MPHKFTASERARGSSKGGAKAQALGVAHKLTASDRAKGAETRRAQGRTKVDAHAAKEALEKANGVVVDAADTLRVSRATLNRWISRTGLRATLRLTYPRQGAGGCPPGTRTVTRRLRRRTSVKAEGLLKIERECEADGEYISIADASGTMATIRLYARTEAGRLADFIRRDGADVSARGHSEQTEVFADIQVSSADERAKVKRLENAIARICGPAVAARIQEEAAK